MWLFNTSRNCRINFHYLPVRNVLLLLVTKKIKYLTSWREEYAYFKSNRKFSYFLGICWLDRGQTSGQLVLILVVKYATTQVPQHSDLLTHSPCTRLLPRITRCPAGGNPAAMQRGRPEEERDHHPLPGNAERHPGPDRGAQQPQHQAVPGEQRPGWETQGTHFTIRPAGGGTNARRCTNINVSNQSQHAQEPRRLKLAQAFLP